MKFFSALLISVLAAATSFPQAKKAMSLEDMYNIKIVGAGVVSPDASKLLFQKTEYSIAQNKTITQYWIKDLYNFNIPYRATYSDSSCSAASWVPSSNMISYLTKRDEKKTQIYTLELKSGAHPRRLTNHSTSIKSYAWLSADKILFTAEEGIGDFEANSLRESGNAYFYGDNKKCTSLWEFDPHSGKEKRLTNGRISVRGYRLSPGGKHMAIIAAPGANTNDENKSEIYIYSLENGSLKQITNNNIMEKQIGWSPDGSYITFVSDANEKLEPYYQDSIFKLELSTGRISEMTRSFPYQILDHQWDSKNHIIYFLANKGVTQQLFSLDVKTGKISQCTFVKGVVRSFSLISKSGRIVLLISTPESPEDFYITEKGKWNPHRITNTNPQLNSYYLGKYKTFIYKSSGGREVEGILIYPYNYNQHQKYPLLVQLHGGPNASYQLSFGFSWATYPNFLSSRGFVIFQPNYSGSSGYGNSFMRSIIGNFFHNGYEDIIAGVDHLVKNGIADPERLGVMGFSAGGHFSNWIITHTNRFKAACIGAGASNWVSFYAQNEVQYLREIWLGNPYTNMDKWMKLSPISHVTNVQTPTFFYCGDQDTRVPFAQTLEMYHGLKRNNVPAKLMVLPKEGHFINDIRHQLAKMKNEYAWIEKYINNR